MSVIIRLQNLPWSASAADIRHYFHGLSIPEGGVHIVGGQLGDAFIAFSTDEDARQAMASDGGMVKDSRVKLFLSSRTEMQKIIEETRIQHLSLQGALPNRQFDNGNSFPVAPTPSVRAPPVLNGNQHNEVVGRPGNYDHHHVQQQSMFQPRGPPSGPSPNGAFPLNVNNQAGYGGPPNQQYGGHVMPGAPMGGFGGHQNPPMDMQPGPSMDRNQSMHHGPPEPERNRDLDRGSLANRRDRDRSRDRSRRDRVPDTRRGKRSRSRSRSSSRGRGRDRRRRSRSRSSSRERRRFRDQDRSGKNGSSKFGLLPTPAEQMENARKQESQTCVQLRMLSGDLTYRDIREYLNGIHIPNTCIKMINGLDGYRFGLAYIQLTHQADKQKALARHNGFIRGCPVQIYHVDDSIFSHAIDSVSPGVPIDSKDLSRSCLALRDFPLNCSEPNVKEAFGSVSLSQVLPERDDSGTPTGLCYVKLSSESDARKAVQILKDGLMICGRPVKVALVPLDELEACRRTMDRHQTGHDDPSSFPVKHAQPPRRPPSYNEPPQKGSFDPPRGPRPNVQRVYISGLPPNAMERDIGDFFSDVGAIPQTIEIVSDDNRMPTGNAYCQFSSPQEAGRALDKNGGFMGGHTVNVTLVEGHEPPANEEMNSYKQFPKNMNQPGPRMYGPGPGGPYPPQNRPMLQGGTGSHGPPNSHMSSTRFGGPRYPPAGGPGYLGPRPPNNMRMRMPMGGPGNNGIPQNGSNPQKGSDGPLNNGPSPNFGAPGCVVGLTNVPYKGTIADILAFFRGYSINEKCVIRRFGPNGQPTGDARVAFPSPDEAQHAMRNLQNEYIGNRRVLLSIVFNDQ